MIKLKDILKITSPCEIIHLVMDNFERETMVHYNHKEMEKYFNYKVTYIDAWESDELRIFIKKEE